eukprot:2373179-Rhodomonas_salina.1
MGVSGCPRLRHSVTVTRALSRAHTHRSLVRPRILTHAHSTLNTQHSTLSHTHSHPLSRQRPCAVLTGTASLQGAETERQLLDRSLHALTDAKGWHSLVKVRARPRSRAPSFDQQL